MFWMKKIVMSPFKEKRYLSEGFSGGILLVGIMVLESNLWYPRGSDHRWNRTWKTPSIPNSPRIVLANGEKDCQGETYNYFNIDFIIDDGRSWALNVVLSCASTTTPMTTACALLFSIRSTEKIKWVVCPECTFNQFCGHA